VSFDKIRQIIIERTSIMKLDIIKSNRHRDAVNTKDIHGKYPYKLYLEIRGNTSIGRYLVVVSTVQLDAREAVDQIVIHMADEKGNIQKASRKNQENPIVKPNMSGNMYMLTYKVREVDVLKVGNEKLQVYMPLAEYKSKLRQIKSENRAKAGQEAQNKAISVLGSGVSKLQSAVNNVAGQISKKDDTGENK
jgi:hypothetical protein